MFCTFITYNLLRYPVYEIN